MTKKEQEFVEIVWEYYGAHARHMPWREAEADGNFDPYKILVSEIMLQQTQVDRVIPKFNEFIKQFPDLNKLANASLSDVLKVWSGLGYNRRAKYLHEVAKGLVNEPFPTTIEELTQPKGIGFNTAAAVLVYSFNEPYIFVETNIRTVFLYHFFKGKEEVDDTEIIAKLEKVLDRENPREFFWALMDYGAHLKKSGVKNISQSKHYAAQSKFKGSARQLRGEILRQAQNGLTLESLRSSTQDKRLDVVLESLEKDGLITLDGGRVTIA